MVAVAFKVVLLTRTDPVLPLHKLRLSGDMEEIRADDLALRPADIATLAQATGVDLTGAVRDRVFERSAGWPAGARLAMLHLTRTGATHDLTGFGGPTAPSASTSPARSSNAKRRRWAGSFNSPASQT